MPSALLAGPSPWLRDAVRTEVPDGVQLKPEAVRVDAEGVAHVGLFSTRTSELLDADLNLLNATGQTVASQAKFLSANIKSREHLLETFLTLDATLTSFQPGDYKLQYVLHDRAADKDVTFEDGLPADGSAFITRGYLYQPGTLTGDGDGVKEDGAPQYPEKLIGEWICSGYMINDAGHAKGGVWVVSTQFFQFGTAPGAETLVSQGYELADVGVAINRAITGGTGQYRDARGQGAQTMLGLNATEGVNLRVKLEVKTR